MATTEALKNLLSSAEATVEGPNGTQQSNVGAVTRGSGLSSTLGTFVCGAGIKDGKECVQIGNTGSETVCPGEVAVTGTLTSKEVATTAVGTGSLNCESSMIVGTDNVPGTVEVNGSIKSTSFTSEHTLSSTTVLTNLNARVVIAAHGYEISDVTTNNLGQAVPEDGEEKLFRDWCLYINAQALAATEENHSTAYLKLFTLTYWSGIKVLPLDGGDFWKQYGTILVANHLAGSSIDECAKVWGSILEHIRGIPSDNQLQDSKATGGFRLQFEYKLIESLSPDDQVVGVPQRKLMATASGDAGPYTEAYKAPVGFNVAPGVARVIGAAALSRCVITTPNTHISGTQGPDSSLAQHFNDLDNSAVPTLNQNYQVEDVSFQRGVELMISFRAARYTKSTTGGRAQSAGDLANPTYPMEGGILVSHTKNDADWVTVQPVLALTLSGTTGQITGLDFDPWYAPERIGQGELWTKISANMIDNACSLYFGAPGAGATFTTSQKREAFYFGLNYETQRGLLEELAFHEFMIGTDLEIYEGKAAFSAAMDTAGYDAAVDMIYTTTDTIKLLAVKTAKSALDAERELRRSLANSLEAAWNAQEVQNTVVETARQAAQELSDLSGNLQSALDQRKIVAATIAANLASESTEKLAQMQYDAEQDVITATTAMNKQKLFLQAAEQASVAAKLNTSTLNAVADATALLLTNALNDTATAAGKASITTSSTVTSDEEINQWYEDNSLYESLKLGYIQMKNLEFRNYVEVNEANTMDDKTETIFCGSAAYQSWECECNNVFKRSFVGGATNMMTGQRVTLDEPDEKSIVYMSATQTTVPRFSLRIADLVGSGANFLTPYYANATRFDSASVEVVGADEVRLAWNNVVGDDAAKQLKLEKSNRIYKVATVPELTNIATMDPTDASGSATLTLDHLKIWVDDSSYSPVGYSDDAGLSSHTISQVHEYATLNADNVVIVVGDTSQTFSISGDLQRTKNASGFIVARSRRDNISFNPSLHGVHATDDEHYLHFYTSNALRLFMNQVTNSILNLEDYSLSVKQDMEDAPGQNAAGVPVKIHRIRYCTTHKAMANTTTIGNNLEGMQINGRDISNLKTGCANIGNTVGQNGNGDLFSFSWSGSYDLSGNTEAEANASYGVAASTRPQIFAPTGFGAAPLGAFGGAAPIGALDGPNNILTTTNALDWNSFEGLAYHFFDHANGWANCAMGLGVERVDGSGLTWEHEDFLDDGLGLIEMPLEEYQLQSGRGLRTTSKYSALQKAQYLVIDSNQKVHTASTNQSSSTLFIATSDRRLKDNIVTISNAFDIVNGLRGVAWDWKKNGVHAAGVIAQELQASPAGYAVHELAPCSELGGKEGYLSVEYNCLWGYMIEAFKEQSRRVAELQKEVLALKEK